MNHSFNHANTHHDSIGVFLPNYPSSYGGLSNDDRPQIPLLFGKSYARSKSLMQDEFCQFCMSLKWCALDHSTSMGRTISYVTFLGLAVVIPVMTSLSVKIPSSAPSEDPLSFNKLLQVPESGLALIGFLTLCRFLKEYGLRQLLFLDVLSEDSLDVQHGYKRELEKAFRYIAYILLPSLVVEFAHKILFFSTVVVSFPVIGVGDVPMDSIMFLLGLASWVYRTGVFLLVCVLFRLTCELQILRLEGLRHMLEGIGSEPNVIFREHRRIREQLYVTSHRFRFFIVGCLLVITVSQLGALLLVLASKSEKNFFNSGDLMVCSAVQLSGFLFCLLGAARITHRAQGIISVATRWHMLVTSSGGTDHSKTSILPNMNESTRAESNERVQSVSESTLHNIITISQDPSTFQIRQALVTYLQHNNGGITVLGFALDRGLLHTWLHSSSLWCCGD